MKKKHTPKLFIIILGLMILSCIPVLVFAQIPKAFNYQGYLTDTDGKPLDTSAGGPISITFSIYNEDGSAEWSQTQDVNVKSGVFNVVLGEGDNPKPINLFFNSQYWLGIKIAGEANEMTPRTMLTSVPYSLNADMVDGQHASDFDSTDDSWTGTGNVTTAGNVGIGKTTPTSRLHIGGNNNSIHLEGTGANNNFGARLTFGDANFTYIEETADDVLTIYAEKEVIFNSSINGFGTTTPVYPIDTGTGAHLSWTGVWTNASSRSYKENIHQLSYDKALKTLEGLNPVEFNYKVDIRDQYVGFIAEDVPELVATKDRKGLSPMDIVAVLTKVVQEQQSKIAELSEKVRGLEKEFMIQ